jgi:hypothetical protein
MGGMIGSGKGSNVSACRGGDPGNWMRLTGLARHSRRPQRNNKIRQTPNIMSKWMMPMEMSSSCPAMTPSRYSSVWMMEEREVFLGPFASVYPTRAQRIDIAQSCEALSGESGVGFGVQRCFGCADLFGRVTKPGCRNGATPWSIPPVFDHI